MDSDLFLVLGLVIGALSFPAVISAFSESRAPRVASIMVVIAGALIVLAVFNKPSGYKLSDVPDVFVHVVGRYLN